MTPKQIQEKYDVSHSMFAIDNAHPDQRPCDLAVCQRGAPILFVLMVLIRIVAIFLG